MTVEHKGYVLQQSDYNNHYMIFKDGRWVCHASCTEKLTEEEAKEHIESFIVLKEMVGEQRKEDEGK